MKNSQQLEFSMENSRKGPGRRPGTKAYLIHQKGVYGGNIQHRKFKRPFHTEKVVHIILRSRLLSGTRSLLRSNRRQWTEDLLKRKAQRHSAKLYNFSINSNHIHLLMKFKNPTDQSAFLRDLSGSLALKIKKTFRIAKSIKVWDSRPFSSLVRSFSHIRAYLEKNRNEAAGLWPYQKRPLSYIEKVLAKLAATPNLKSTA